MTSRDDGGALVGHPQPHRAPPPRRRRGSRALPCAALKALTSLGARRGAVGVAAVDQLLDDLGVPVGALGLEDGVAVPVELEPAQRLEDLLDVLRRGALAVGVLDAQDEARRRGPGPGASCTVPSALHRCGGPRSERERSERASGHSMPWKMSVQTHADRSPRLPRRRARQRGRARRSSADCTAIQFFNQSPRAWRPREYSDEEVAAFHEAMDASRRRRAADPRRLPAQLRLRGRGDPRQVADRADRALHAGAALTAAGVVLHPGSALKDGGVVDEAIERAGEVIAEALEESARLPAAPRGHGRRRRDARALVRGARRADRGRGRRRAPRRLPGLLPPAGLGLRHPHRRGALGRPRRLRPRSSAWTGSARCTSTTP